MCSSDLLVLEEMSKFALNLLTTSHIFQPTSSLDPDLLIHHISEEADCLTAWCKRDGTLKGKGRQARPQDEALAATQNDRGGCHCHKGKCCNCSKEGHWVQECRSPKKEGLDQEGNPQDSQQSTQQQGQAWQQQGQHTQPPAYLSLTKGDSKPVGSANVVIDPGKEDDGVWTVMMADNADAPKDTEGAAAVIATVEET